MFVIVSTYRAKAGEEDAIIALYEEWQRSIQPRATGYLSGELLSKVGDPREFIAIMRFESLGTALVLAKDPVQDTWYRRVVSLTEHRSMLTEYAREWP